MPSKGVEMAYAEIEVEKLSRIGVIAERLQNIRDEAKAEFGSKLIGIEICAGVRPEKWELLQGRSGKSQHVEYWTADFIPICENDEDYVLIFDWIVKNYKDNWKGGFAVKNYNLKEGKKGFIHADCRMGKARWKY